MAALFTDQITLLANQSKKLKQFYQGTYGGDQLKEKWRTEGSYPKFLIANTAPASQPGDHWIACIIHSSRQIEIFDSYGHRIQSYSSPLSHYADKFLVRKENDHQWQSMFSSICGHYCLFYLYYRAHGLTPQRIFHRLNRRNHIINDRKVTLFVKRILRPKKGNIRAYYLCKGQCAKKQCFCRSTRS